MNKSSLAAELGISPSMAARLAKRGMPTDSVEAARAWRSRNLLWTRTKGVRADTVPPAPPRPAAVNYHADTVPDAMQLRLAQRIGELAEHDFESQEAGLRLALMVLSPQAKEQLLLPLEVWAKLLPPGFIDEVRTPPGEEQQDMTPEALDIIEGLMTGRLVYTPPKRARRG